MAYTASECLSHEGSFERILGESILVEEETNHGELWEGWVNNSKLSLPMAW